MSERERCERVARDLANRVNVTHLIPELADALEAARAEGYQAGVEAAAKYAHTVAVRWHDAGDYQEASCAMYLVAGIRTLKEAK